MDNYDKIKNDPSHIKTLNEDQQLNKLCWLALVIDPSSIQWIHNQTTKKIRYALQRDPMLIKYIKPDGRTHGFCRWLISNDPTIFPKIMNVQPYISRWAIRKYPNMIKYIKPDHPDYNKICEVALSKDQTLFHTIINPPINAVINALKRNYHLLQYIDKQQRSNDVYRIAARRSRRAFQYLDKDEYTIDILRHFISKYVEYDTVEEALIHIALTFRMFSFIKDPPYNVIMALINKGLYYYNSSVSLDHLSDDEILYILSKHGNWIRMISDSRVTLEFCHAGAKTANILGILPERFISYDLCLESVKYNYNALASVPDHLIDRTIVRQALLKYAPNLRMKGVAMFLDYNLCLDVAKSHQKFMILRYFPNELLDYKICYEAVKGYSLNICDVPDRIINHDICMRAVKTYGDCLQFIPDKYMCQEIVDVACRTYPQAFTQIDIKYHNRKLWQNLIFHQPHTIYSCPADVIDDDLLFRLFTHKTPSLYGRDVCLQRFNDYEFCKKMIEINPMAIAYMEPTTFYDLWIKSAERCSTAINRIICYTDITDEYLYFTSFNKNTLCDKCGSYGFWLGSDGRSWLTCEKCNGYLLSFPLHDDTTFKLIFGKRRIFFKRVQMFRLVAYLRFAKANGLISTDPLLQSILNVLPFDVVKLIVLQLYNYSLNEYIKDASINLICSRLLVDNAKN